MKNFALFSIVSVALLAAGAVAFAEQVFDLVDDSVNQPLTLTTNEGDGWAIYPIPSGFTCTLEWTDHCPATGITNIGDPIMKRFAVVYTGTLADGTYTLFRENYAQCTDGMDIDDCKATGNEWQEFTMPPSSPTSTPTSTAVTLTPTEARDTYLLYILDGLWFFFILTMVFIALKYTFAL